MRETVASDCAVQPVLNIEAKGRQISRAGLGWIAGFVGLFTFSACYLRNFVLPNVPVLLWADQMLYATNGARILAGQMPYRDYFQFLPPGTDLIYAFLFRCFGASLWIPNLLMNGLAAAVAVLITLAGSRVLGRGAVALPAIFLLGFGLYGGLDATHHWFSTVFALAAMLVLLYGIELRHLVWAGVFCGLMASFTQSKGAAVTLGLLIYIAWRSKQQERSLLDRWQQSLLLAVTAFTVFFVINSYYIFKLGIAEWCRWLVIFPFRYYPTMPGQTWRSPALEFRASVGPMKWCCASFLYLAVPLIYLNFLRIMRRYRRADPDQPWDQLLLVAIVGLAMFVSVAPSLSIMRASTVAAPAMILMAWHLTRAGKTIRWAQVAALALSIASTLYLALSNQRMHWNYLSLPAGRTAILDPARYDLYQWMQLHTRPGQVYLGISPLSLPLHLETPGPIQSPGPWEYYRPEHIAHSIDALESNHIPLLVLRPYTQFQDAPGYEPKLIRPFQDYIFGHYRRTKTFATGDEVWQRLTNEPPANH